MGKLQIKPSDRVRRISGDGCHGTVKEIREEVTLSSDTNREVGYIVVVLWDNGTLSAFSPEGVEKVAP
jgi:hypothetical protein